MVKNEYHFIKNILIAPIGQIGLDRYKPRYIFKSYLHDMSYPCVVEKIKSENIGTEVVSCVFCEMEKISETFPVFEIDDDNNVLTLRKIEHACKDCSSIALLSETNKVNAISRIQLLIETTNDFEPDSYVGDRSDVLVDRMLGMIAEIEKKSWTWDLTFLKRRSLSNNDIYESFHDISCPTPTDSNKAVPFLWSEFTSVKDFYESHNKK